MITRDDIEAQARELEEAVRGRLSDLETISKLGVALPATPEQSASQLDTFLS